LETIAEALEHPQTRPSFVAAAGSVVPSLVLAAKILATSWKDGQFTASGFDLVLLVTSAVAAGVVIVNYRVAAKKVDPLNELAKKQVRKLRIVLGDIQETETKVPPKAV